MSIFAEVFKSAFISIIGLPNAGKSTLLNSILGEKLVITNKKAQTTRHRIKGIFTDKTHQFVFSDTPGIIGDTAYLLQEQMMKAVTESLEDADILLFVIDIKNPKAVEALKGYANNNIPTVVALNKVDTTEQDRVKDKIQEISEQFNTEHVYPVSALEEYNIESLMECLREISPEHPAYYEEDIISDENTRFLVSEIIRDQMLIQFKKEVPYSAEVSIDDYDEEDGIDKIYATIYLERDSQKAIVLGRGGAAIKRLGTDSRKRIESFVGKKVFLSLSLKIRKNWRKDENQLKRFGYIKK